MDAKFTLNHAEVQKALANYLGNKTGFHVNPNDIAFHATNDDNPHSTTRQIEISVTARAT